MATRSRSISGDPDELVTPTEFAGITKISTATQRVWRRRGRVSFVRLGPRQIRYRRSDVQALIERGIVPAASTAPRTKSGTVAIAAKSRRTVPARRRAA